MDTVIILKGASNRGKTPTLHLLIDYFIDETSATIDYNDGYASDIHKDCFVILDVPDFGKVGIITYGDRGCEDSVDEALSICIDRNCRCVIGASHTRESSYYQTIYSKLWQFGRDNHAKIIETTNYVKWEGWGQAIYETHLNSICAKNLANLIIEL